MTVSRCMLQQDNRLLTSTAVNVGSAFKEQDIHKSPDRRCHSAIQAAAAATPTWLCWCPVLVKNADGPRQVVHLQQQQQQQHACSRG
jgi:hypothetical protein